MWPSIRVITCAWRRGSGQVAGFFKTFTYTPVIDNKPYPEMDGGEEGFGYSQQVGSS